MKNQRGLGSALAMPLGIADEQYLDHNQEKEREISFYWKEEGMKSRVKRHISISNDLSSLIA